MTILELIEKMEKERFRHYFEYVEVFHSENPDKTVAELAEGNYVEEIYNFYKSFLPSLLADYSNNLYWSSKEYLVACYKSSKSFFRQNITPKLK